MSVERHRTVTKWPQTQRPWAWGDKPIDAEPAPRGLLASTASWKTQSLSTVPGCRATGEEAFPAYEAAAKWLSALRN